MGEEAKIWDGPMDRYPNQAYKTMQDDGNPTRPGETGCDVVRWLHSVGTAVRQ